MVELVFWARAGQGVIWAAEVFVAAALAVGKHATALPMYAMERPGFPFFVAVRLDDRPVRQKDMVASPDCLVFFDPAMPRLSGALGSLRPGGLVVLDRREGSDPRPEIPGAGTVGEVDAAAAASATLGKDAPAAVLLGALIASAKLLPAQAVASALGAHLNHHPRMRLERVGHEAAFWRGHATTRVYEVGR